MSAAEEDAKNGGGAAARRKLAALAAARKANHGDSSDAFLVEGDILGVQKKKKNSYEERLAKIAEGREGREKFGSHKHKKLDDKAHSTTNQEKKRKKNFAMVSHSYNVTSKGKASLHQKSKKLRNHVNRYALLFSHAYPPSLLTVVVVCLSLQYEEWRTTKKRRAQIELLDFLVSEYILWVVLLQLFPFSAYSPALQLLVSLHFSFLDQRFTAFLFLPSDLVQSDALSAMFKESEMMVRDQTHPLAFLCILRIFRIRLRLPLLFPFPRGSPPSPPHFPPASWISFSRRLRNSFEI